MFVSEKNRYKIDKFFKSKRSITKMGWFIHTPGLSMMCGPMDQAHVTWFIPEHCHSDGNMVGFLFLTHFFYKIITYINWKQELTDNWITVDPSGYKYFKMEEKLQLFKLIPIHPDTNLPEWRKKQLLELVQIHPDTNLLKWSSHFFRINLDTKLVNWNRNTIVQIDVDPSRRKSSQMKPK